MTGTTPSFARIGNAMAKQGDNATLGDLRDLASHRSELIRTEKHAVFARPAKVLFLWHRLILYHKIALKPSNTLVAFSAKTGCPWECFDLLRTADSLSDPPADQSWRGALSVNLK